MTCLFAILCIVLTSSKKIFMNPGPYSTLSTTRPPYQLTLPKPCAASGLNVLIVDDGSREECKPVLQGFGFRFALMSLYRPINGGKAQWLKLAWNTLKNMAIPTSCRLMQTASISERHSQTPRRSRTKSAVVCGWPHMAMMRPKHGFTDAKLPTFGICCAHSWSCDIKDRHAASASIRLHPRCPSSAKKP